MKQQEIVPRQDGGNVLVSTVHLPYPHGSALYETMVFPVDENGDVDYLEIECDRYTTQEDAAAGHTKMVNKYLAQ